MRCGGHRSHTAPHVAQACKTREREPDCMRMDRQRNPEQYQKIVDYLRPGLFVPGYWNNRELRNLGMSAVRCEWFEGCGAIRDMLLRTALHHVCDGRDGTFCTHAVRGVRVWRVENPLLWKQYQNKAEEMSNRHEMRCP